MAQRSVHTSNPSKTKPRRLVDQPEQIRLNIVKEPQLMEETSSTRQMRASSPPPRRGPEGAQPSAPARGLPSQSTPRIRPPPGAPPLKIPYVHAIFAGVFSFTQN